MALLYAIKLRRRRERYQGGIKALGDHMQGIWDIESTPKPRGQRDPVAPSMTGIKSTPAPGVDFVNTLLW